MIQLKAPWELAIMRANGRRLAEVAFMLREAIMPGVTTADLDRLAEERIRQMGALPSFKGYRVPRLPPFPATICASPNEQVVHGIPNNRPLQAGQIISVDMGLHYGGYHADMAFTAPVGDIDDRVRVLLDVTRESLYIGIARALPGLRVGDVGHAIENTVGRYGLGIVRQYVGHGIGRQLHERPSVPNYGKPNTLELLKPGMCLAIEPMITLGTGETRTLKDKWTVVTADGSWAAHFEHTIAITSEGPEILTILDGESPSLRDPIR